jgi:hypothetical protein
MEPPHKIMIYYIPSDVPEHKKHEHVWFRGEDLNGFRGEDLNGFKDTRKLPVSGRTEVPHMVMTYIINHQISLDTRIKDMYSLGEGISMVFVILEHFLFKGGQIHPIWS